MSRLTNFVNGRRGESANGQTKVSGNGRTKEAAERSAPLSRGLECAPSGRSTVTQR